MIFWSDLVKVVAIDAQQNDNDRIWNKRKRHWLVACSDWEHAITVRVHFEFSFNFGCKSYAAMHFRYQRFLFCSRYKPSAHDGIQCCGVGMVRFLSCDWFCIAIILFLWYHLDRRRFWTASACFLYRSYYNWVSFVGAPFIRNCLSFLNSWKHMNSNL